MYVKLIGGAALLVSVTVFGKLKAAEVKKKITFLYDLCSFVRFTDESISHLRTPLPDIISSFQPRTEELAKILNVAHELGFRESYQKYTGILSSLATSESKSVIAKFMTEIGYGHTKESHELCSYTANILEVERERLKADSTNKIKMWNSLPPLLAASVILILM